MTAPTAPDFRAWWHELGSAALVGTARRPVPEVPALQPGLAIPAGTRAEEALLAAAALGGAALQAGRVPGPGSPAVASGPDRRPAAPRRAVQLLELVLTQSPAGAHQRPLLLTHWLRVADDHGFRLPHAILPLVLDTATADRDLRRPTAAVLDARGAWLASHRADWAWAAERPAGLDKAVGEVTQEDWARVPSGPRVTTLAGLRARDPATARSLIESTWATDSAKDRRAHLETLRIGLGLADEDLLETALDDRAASVREVATDLLDALPDSARGTRMAARLRPLLESKGVLKRHLDVTLPDQPDQPDPVGVRDGLGKPPPGRSARGWWLERLAAAAPLEVWTTASGADPATTAKRLTDEDALRGIRRAVLARRDGTWAHALLERSWDPELVQALPREAREGVVLARLTAAARPVHELAGLLRSVPSPWSADFSSRVLARLRSSKSPALVVGQAMPHLVAGLHPLSLDTLEDWLAHSRDDTALATHLRNLLQFHSVKRSISEAFT